MINAIQYIVDVNHADGWWDCLKEGIIKYHGYIG